MTELLFGCQQKVVHNLMVHPVNNACDLGYSQNPFSPLTPHLVEHHELVPVAVDRLWVEVSVEPLARVLQEALDVAERSGDPLLLVQPRGDVLHAEPLRILGEPGGNEE